MLLYFLHQFVYGSLSRTLLLTFLISLLILALDFYGAGIGRMAPVIVAASAGRDQGWKQKGSQGSQAG